MKLEQMHILIIGAGIGGLGLAIALRMRGASVVVLEQAPEIQEVGAGLQISPNAFRVIQALGLGEQVAAAGVWATQVRLFDYKGAPVTQVDLSQLASPEYHFLHRADLIEVLAERAREVGVEIRLNHAVKAVEIGETSQVLLSSGDKLTADLIVGADGLHSQTRRALCGGLEPFFTGQVAWRALVPNANRRGPQVHLHMGPHRHLVSYPLRGGDLLNVVAVQERDQWTDESWSQEDDPANLRAAFADFGPEVQQMLSAVDKVHLRGLFRHPVAPVWHGQGVALLGDAAHPTLPFLAQGAAMALEDAWVLADALSLPGEVPTRLAAYQTRRESRVRRVVDAASANAWKYHLANPLIRFAAHTVLRVGGKMFPDRLAGQFDWLYDEDVTG